MKRVLFVLAAVVLGAALSITAFAETSNFVPSIEVKTAPEVVETQMDGMLAAALIVSGDTTEAEEGVPLYSDGAASAGIEFYIVSAAEKSEAKLEEIKENLTNAEEQIKSVADVGKLTEGLNEKIEEKLDQYFGDAKDKLAVSDLVVSDLFDISLIENKTEIKQLGEGKKLKFLLKPNFQKGDFFILLHNISGNDWVVVDDVEWTDEGYLSVAVDAMSPFAFVVERSADLPVDPDDPGSPQTSDKAGYTFLYAGAAVLCIGAAAVFFAQAEKRKRTE